MKKIIILLLLPLFGKAQDYILVRASAALANAQSIDASLNWNEGKATGGGVGIEVNHRGGVFSVPVFIQVQPVYENGRRVRPLFHFAAGPIIARPYNAFAEAGVGGKASDFIALIRYRLQATDDLRTMREAGGWLFSVSYNFNR